jgi:hypothetical protein
MPRALSTSSAIADARGTRLLASRRATSTEFARHASPGHPWVRIPTARAGVLSSAREAAHHRVDRRHVVRPVPFAAESDDTKQRAAEVMWRFAQHRHRPPRDRSTATRIPGNYKFHHDGSVTFLDFGLVKRWSPGEWESLRPTARRDDRPSRRRNSSCTRWRTSRFLRARSRPRSGAGLRLRLAAPTSRTSPTTFTFTREWMRDTTRQDLRRAGTAPAASSKQLNMPPSFVILDRVVWGVSAILGKLEVHRLHGAAMLLEYIDRRRPRHRPRSRGGRRPPHPLTPRSRDERIAGIRSVRSSQSGPMTTSRVH